MAKCKIKVGNIKDVSGKGNNAASDILKNINRMHPRARTAAEEVWLARLMLPHWELRGRG